MLYELISQFYKILKIQFSVFINSIVCHENKQTNTTTVLWLFHCLIHWAITSYIKYSTKSKWEWLCCNLHVCAMRLSDQSFAWPPELSLSPRLQPPQCLSPPENVMGKVLSLSIQCMAARWHQKWFTTIGILCVIRIMSLIKILLQSNLTGQSGQDSIRENCL